MWSNRLVFCECDFHSVCPLMEKDKRLMGASWWERLTERETGSCLMGGAVLSKSWIQFSVDAVLPPCYFTWDQTMAEVMKIMGPPSKGPMHALPHSGPQLCTGHCCPTPPLETPGHSWAVWALMQFYGEGETDSMQSPLFPKHSSEVTFKPCEKQQNQVVNFKGFESIQGKLVYARPKAIYL